MKLLIVIAVIAIISHQILTEELTKKKRSKARRDCQEKSDVDYDVLDQALKGNFQEDQKLKEHSKCFFEEIDVLKGNDINNEKLEEYVKIALPDKKDQAKQIAQECSQKKKDKPEETAFQVGKCVLEKKKE